jgi:hypothetical protein
MTANSPYFTQCGLPGIDLIPFGMHACHFYDGPEQLAQALAPYFVTGLELNERCLWITAPPLPASEAVKALSAAWPGVEEALRSGALRVLDSDAWYGAAGRPRPQDMVQIWLDEEERALADGRAGLRIAGNISFLEPEDWPAFMAYEQSVSERFNGRRIVALCSYMLAQCDWRKRREVLRSHHCMLARGEPGWQVVPSGDRLEPNPGAQKRHEAPARALYTFDCRRADDAAICLEAHERRSDSDALALARKLLTQHLTASRVEVFEADRLVGAVEREARRHERDRGSRCGADGTI